MSVKHSANLIFHEYQSQRDDVQNICDIITPLNVMFTFSIMLQQVKAIHWYLLKSGNMLGDYDRNNSQLDVLYRAIGFYIRIAR